MTRRRLGLRRDLNRTGLGLGLGRDSGSPLRSLRGKAGRAAAGRVRARPPPPCARRCVPYWFTPLSPVCRLGLQARCSPAGAGPAACRSLPWLACGTWSRNLTRARPPRHPGTMPSDSNALRCSGFTGAVYMSSGWAAPAAAEVVAAMITAVTAYHPHPAPAQREPAAVPEVWP